MLLRIEDIDLSRARPQYYDAIKEDLAWLGLGWDGVVRVQSQHMEDYSAALEKLIGLGVTYPCFCTRRAIQVEIDRSGGAPQGPDGPLYPQTCRHLKKADVLARMSAGATYAVRLDAMKAAALTGHLTWDERDIGVLDVDPLAYGDFVIARRDVPTSYHLSVVVDDDLQGVTLVTRGEDLRPATQPQRMLQSLLDLRVPEYRHHGLVIGADGKRLAKRDASTTVQSLRTLGMSARDVLAAAKASVRTTFMI